jgi:hypothetical protein
MEINQQTAEEAYQLVLENAGATLPKRDPIDARIVDEVRNGYATYEGLAYKQQQSVPDESVKCGIIDSQDDVGGWPELKSTVAPADTDHDGMPDEWEVLKGLDPNNPADRNTTAPDGTTMLETYLNGIASNQSGDVDTGDFLGWVNTAYAPYMWVYTISKWVYLEKLPENALGAWVYFFNGQG